MSAPLPKERVLATLNPDGSRHWIRPRLSPGRYLMARRMFAYFLIVLFAVLPYVRINGKPALLLDIVHRRFHILGTSFFPTDTMLLALFMISMFVSIILITALLGRVWCGWACPQTVYMEFLFRPIERFFDGAPGSKQKIGGAKGARKAMKYFVFFLCAIFVSHTFLSYFVGTEQLYSWVKGSPARHPLAFLVMAAVTALMLFDFGFFREQVCLVACPYGRFQSAMLDRDTMIISYDKNRGEPRGAKKRKKQAGADLSLPVVDDDPAGDCIDCRMCVTTCPTGIDIRDGLQMECIGCAQCIDACNAVMKKVGRPLGLIRYTSQRAVESGKARVFRPRLILYVLVLGALASLFVGTLLTRGDADLTVLRGRGRPFVETGDGMIANTIRVKVANRLDEPQEFTITVSDLEGASLASGEGLTFEVAGGEIGWRDVQVIVPAGAFRDGEARATFGVTTEQGFKAERSYPLLGPVRRASQR